MMKLNTNSFYQPIIFVLQSLGGKARTAEVIARVIDHCKITEDDYEKLSTKTERGIGVLHNRIRWAKQYLVIQKYLYRGGAHGYWELSDKGAEFDCELDSPVLRSFQSQSVSADAEMEDRENAGIAIPGDEHRKQLIDNLRDLSTGGFERVCARLVREMGFENVEGTPLTRDGGIDGVGVLVVNPLVKNRFVYQCKKYAENNTVGEGAVRDFESAARRKRAEMGAIITTSRFSQPAKAHVAECDFSIELIDGDALVELFVEYKLGVNIRQVREVDDSFFAKFKDKS